VRFTGVNGYDITDRLTVRIASINGRSPEAAGISRIEPMPVSKMRVDRNFTIYNGAIRPSSNNSNLGAVTIPAELWGERVTAIANVFQRRGLTSVTISRGIVAIPDNAFANNQLTRVTIGNGVTSIGASAFANNQLSSVTIPSSLISIGNSAFANNRLTSVTIPEGVTTIGDRAFAENHWTTNERKSDGSYETRHHGLTRVIVADSVTSIGQEAFASHWITTHSSQNGSYTVDHWLVTEVTIGANVSIGNNAMGNGFEAFYTKSNRQAGVYRAGIFKWERFDSVGAKDQTVAKRNKVLWGFIITTGVGGVAGLITAMIVVKKNKK